MIFGIPIRSEHWDRIGSGEYIPRDEDVESLIASGKVKARDLAVFILSDLMEDIWPAHNGIYSIELVRVANYGSNVCLIFMIGDNVSQRTSNLPPPEIIEKMIVAMKGKGIHDKIGWYHARSCPKCGTN